MDMQEYREGNTVWVARLSNGEEICQYDVDGQDSWARLRQKCNREGIAVTGLSINFRTNSYHLPPNQSGYMFCRGVLSSLTKNFNLCSIGYLRDDNSVVVKQFIVPEILEWEEQIREKYQCPTLIINHCMVQQDL